MSGDLRPSMTDALEAFGVDATVQRDGSPDIQTRAIWCSPLEMPGGYGEDLGRIEPRLILALTRVDVTDLPIGTTIQAPEMDGGPVRTWQVEGYALRARPDEVRVFVTLQE